MRARLFSTLFWLLPPLAMLLVHGQGLRAWFQQDDFAWLGLLREVREGTPLLEALFRPSQHGTWRPLSERAYFLFFPWVFGNEAWPMRVAAFLTQAGSLALLQAITHRLTASRLAALLAPILWIVNSKLSIAMISNGAYVHVLGGFLLLLAAWCLLTNRKRAMWAVFATGFLASESNVVFPALASAWALLYARHRLRETLWLWPASLAYFLFHMAIAPKMNAGSYALYFDLSMLRTLASYAQMAFEADNLKPLTGLPEAWSRWSGLMFPLAVPALALLQRQKAAALFLLWFLILLGPVLPLRDHITGYYLTIPLAALGMLVAAVATRWRGVLPLLFLYLLVQVPAAYQTTSWWQRRGETARRLVRAVWAVHQANPGKILVLEGVSDEQFWAAIAHYPFVERRQTYVFLAPDTRERIQPHPESGVRLEEFFAPSLPPDAIRFRVPE